MKYSSRLPSAIESNEISELLYSKKQSRGCVLDLTVSNISETYEANAQGTLAARGQIVKHWRPEQRLCADQLFLTASTSEAYSTILKLFCDPGDEVLVPTPSYPLLTHLVEAEGCKAIKYSLFEAEGWFVDLRALEELITDKTKILLLVHPNNPTGSYLSWEQMHSLATLANKHGLALVSDEVFFEYALVEDAKLKSFLDLPLKDTPVFVLGGMSKLLGLPGKKLSWVYVHAKPETTRDVLPKLLWLLDLYLSVNEQVQKEVGSLFHGFGDQPEVIRRRIRANHAYLAGRLNREKKVNYVLNQGGWNAILRFSETVDAAKFCKDLLEKKNVYVYPGDWFDMPFQSIVVSLLCEPKIFEQAIATLLDFFEFKDA